MMQDKPADLQLYYRLIALWVISEAVLGGMIHGLKIPVSGLIVGSCAVICICLIGYYIPFRGAILKATVIVAVFKMLLSPQAPPPAYIAVFFQGLVGQILFTRKKFFKLSCILLGVLALVESALQRIIVLMIVYGNNFWKAVNEFISKLTGETSVTNYSLGFAIGYVGVHAVVGIAVGLFAIHITGKSSYIGSQTNYFIRETSEKELRTPEKKKRIRIIALAIWIMLLLAIVQSSLGIGRPILPKGEALQIFLRSLLILLSWYLIVNPILNFYFKKWLKKQRSGAEKHISQVALLLPSTQYLLTKSWQLSAREKGWKRILECCKIILVNTLHKHA